MTTPVSTIYLYLSAAKGLKNPVTGAIMYDVPEDAFKCENEQYLKMTLVQHTMTNTLRNIPSGSTLRLTGAFGSESYPLQAGVYTIAEAVSLINSLQSRLAVSYDKHTNRMVFTALPGAVTATIDGNASYLFGMRPSDASIEVTGAAISRHAVVPQYVTDICVHVSGIMPGPPQNVGNVATRNSLLDTSTVAGIIPIRAAPGRVNVFQNVADTFQIQVYDTDVQRLEFTVTDINGDPISDITDWTAVIKVDTFNRPRQDPVVAALSGIADMIRIFILKMAVTMDDD